MRVACLPLLPLVAALALASGTLPAQESPPPQYALALRARYLPLESVRDGTVRMPKALERRVSVHRAEVPLQQVLLDIATQAGLGLSYGEDLAQSKTVVSLEVTNATAAEALASAVRQTRWSVLVNASGQVAVVPVELRVLGVVTGRVTDRVNAAPIAGATLTIEGTRLAATSNDSGAYRITGVPAGTYTLGVRRIGYARASQTVSLAADQTVSVLFALEPTASTLDQIVVTGVPGAVSKRTLGNAITTIDAEELTQKVVNTNVTELLQATAPGVTVMRSSGTPGTGGTIRIRGVGSLTGAVSPVVYVDGVRIHSGVAGNFRNSWESPAPMLARSGGGQDAFSLDMIDPDEIESIEVIKGPAAATLYGADAANGVIQIITKKGARGAQKLQWTAKAQAGQTDWGLDRRESFTTCTAARIADTLAGGSPAYPGCQGKTPNSRIGLTSLEQPGALRDGNLHNLSLSLRGGTPASSFFTAAENEREQGVFANSENTRSSGRANLAFYPREQVNFTVNFGYTRNSTRFPQGDNASNLLESAWTFKPGSAPATGQSDGFSYGSPEQLTIYDNRLRSDRVTFGTTLNVTPWSWLQNRLTVGADLSSNQANRYVAPGSLWSPTEGQMTQGAPRNSIYTVDYAGTIKNTLPWSSLGSAFSVGVQYTNTQYRNTVAQGNNFPSGTTRDVSLAAVQTSWTEFSDVKSLGFYAQEQVDWKDRLYLTGALRVDNSSVFGDDIKQLYYPKVSASYVISEEPFFKLGWLDQVKLRAAWGQAGNAPDPFAAIKSYTLTKSVDPVTNTVVSALRLDSKGNADVKPERGNEIELGFDAAFRKGRGNLEFTYYNKTTKDALMRVPIPPSEGYVGSVFENLGEIRNSGVEVALDLLPVQLDRLTWDARIGVSTNSNELVKFGFARGPVILGLTTPNQRHVEGFPLGGFWVHDPIRGSDGTYTASEARYVGSSNPTREASFGNTITFLKNFRLFTLLDYKGGFYVLNQTDWRRCTAGVCEEVNDPNVSDEMKRQLQLALEVNDALYTQKGDFIKWRDVSLTYALPTTAARRVGAARASVTLAGHNLGFLWKPDYKGLDPEVNFSGDNGPTGSWAFTRVDYWTMPMTRRFTAALEISF
jgi:TonB-dependent starch-binding outer membrane protein SusC